MGNSVYYKVKNPPGGLLFFGTIRNLAGNHLSRQPLDKWGEIYSLEREDAG